jgi:cyclopropane-fatty-acyl-phospholipid synthase
MTDTVSSLRLDRRPGLLARVIERIGQRWLAHEFDGALDVTLVSGGTLRLGSPGIPASAHLTFRSYRVLRRAMARGSIGFAESYMDGDVEVDDLVGLFRFFLNNRRRLTDAGRGLFRVRLPDRLFHRRRTNSKRGSRRNIAHHYDLGNAFYRQWLDPSMTYSSALFATGEESLEEAQVAKYDRALDLLGLKSGNSVLEIGCGWGGMARRAASRGLAVDGITLSREQLAWARAHNAGFDEAARFHFRDYRDTQGQFDGVLSIEMIEAVGEEHWPAYFRTVADRLKPGGAAVIQAIVMEPAVFATYRRKVDFIQRYVFPGGMLLTTPAIRAEAERAGLTLTHVEAFGQSYARTLNLWRERFEAHWSDIAPLGFDERFRRLWRYYLTYCEAGFLDGVIDVGFYRLEKR